MQHGNSFVDRFGDDKHMKHSLVKMKKNKTSSSKRYQRRASFGTIEYRQQQEFALCKPKYQEYHFESEEAMSQAVKQKGRRTSLPAVLIPPPKPILMEAKHVSELNEIVTDLLNSVKDLTQPVILSLNRIKALLEPYERRLTEQFIDNEAGCHADSSELSDDEPPHWSRGQSFDQYSMCSSIPRGHMPQQSHKRPRPELRADGSSSTQKGHTKAYPTVQQNLQQRQAHTLAETSGYDTDNGGIVESDYGKSDSYNNGQTGLPGGQQQRTRNNEQSVGLSMMVQYGMNKVTTTTAPATTQGTQSVVSGGEYQSNNNGSSNRIRPGERHDNDSESNQSTTSRAGSNSSSAVIDCKVDELLAQNKHWNFPIFELRDATQEVLSKLAYRLFDLSGLFNHFRLPRDKFLSYFHALEQGYQPVAYHNSTHAADVLQSVWCLINSPPAGETKTLAEQINKDEILALLLAAAIHDFDHPGYTNSFLVARGDPLAILYNDRSVLENHHVASAWKLMISDKRHQFLNGLDSALLTKIRLRTIDLVLSTDLTKHFDILKKWEARFTNGSVDIKDEETRNTMMRMIIKFSDIANPAKEYESHKKWSRLVSQEFYMQGDEERKCGLKISPFMDRHKQDLIKNQMNFIKSIVRPCFESLSSHDYLIHRNNSIIGRQLQENELTWEMTRVDQDTGLLIVPDKDEIEKLVIERRKIEQFDHVPIKQQSECDGLICEEVVPEPEPISNGSWSEPQHQQNGLLNACCAPIFSVFRRKYRNNQRYRE